MKPIKPDRSESEAGRLDEEIAALVKGMLYRGDKQSDIAACFLINSGRVAEINTGQIQRYVDVQARAMARAGSIGDSKRSDSTGVGRGS